jgi:hypothetical protein
VPQFFAATGAGGTGDEIWRRAVWSNVATVALSYARQQLYARSSSKDET